MTSFKEHLYDATLFAFRKVLSRYDASTQGLIAKEMGREIFEYLKGRGYEVPRKESFDDVFVIVDMFARNGFVENLEIIEERKGQNRIDPLALENRQLLELAEERAARLAKLLKELKTLQGLLPICSNCKKIRDDQGYWKRLEHYLQEHSQATFSHGLCPDCLKELYPDLEGELTGTAEEGGES
jgi:DNA repair exonuclease SbcCD ATPase subunit